MLEKVTMTISSGKIDEINNQIKLLESNMLRNEMIYLLATLREARLLLECAAESLSIVNDDVEQDTHKKIIAFLKESESEW